MSDDDALETPVSLFAQWAKALPTSGDEVLRSTAAAAAATTWPPFYLTRAELHAGVDREFVRGNVALLGAAAGSAGGGLAAVVFRRLFFPPAPEDPNWKPMPSIGGEAPKPALPTMMERYARGSLRSAAVLALVGYGYAYHTFQDEELVRRADEFLSDEQHNQFAWAFLTGAEVGTLTGATIFARKFAGTHGNSGVPRRAIGGARGAMVFAGLFTAVQASYVGFNDAVARWERYQNRPAPDMAARRKAFKESVEAEASGDSGASRSSEE
jgi:hypothetical protein